MAYRILQTMPLPTVWAADENNYLSAKVKKLSPEKLTEVRQKWWEEELNDADRSLILGLPNFRADIFKETTSIDVDKKGEK